MTTSVLPSGIQALVLLGSISDKDVAAQMVPVFADFGVTAHFEVCSAHRDHERLADLLSAAEANGCRVIVAMAGKAAHLPGVCAAITTLPVIGIPVESGMLGLDALLSIAQMPPGIPVATVGVGAGRNAALLAVAILSGASEELRTKLKQFRQGLRDSNRKDSVKLREELGKGPA